MAPCARSASNCCSEIFSPGETLLNTPPPTTAFAYLRVSTRKQDEENQRLHITQYAAKHSILIPDDGWFVDHDVSGWKVPLMKREGFRDMFETLQALKSEGGGPTNVIAYEVSRLGRNFWEVLELMKQLEDNWPLISTSPKEDFLQLHDRSMRQLILAILTWVAQRERENTVQRINEGLARASSEGRHSGNLPMGFKQHVCRIEHGARDRSEYCEKHGKLYLDTMGSDVKKMLEEKPQLRAIEVSRAFPNLGYSSAYKLLQSVKRFGNSSVTLSSYENQPTV